MRFKVPFFSYVLAIIGLLLPSVALVAVLPSFINSEPVRTRLIAELNEWTGGQVKMGRVAAVSNIFSISVEVHGVEIKNFMKMSSSAYMKADKIIANVSTFDLLFGDLTFNILEIQKGVIRVQAADVRDTATSLLAMLSGPKGSSFAAFVLNDSLVAIRDRPGRAYRRLHIDHVTVRTPKGNEFITAGGTLHWGGQPVRFSMRKPIGTGATGVRMPLKVQLDSPLLSGQFEGESTLAGAWDATGRFIARTPDFPRLSEWIGIDDRGVAPGGIELKGLLDLSQNVLAVQSAELSVGGQTASGNLTVKLSEPMPRVEGALAFASINLDEMLTGLTGIADADLRISSEKLTWQGVNTGAAAFALTVNAGLVSAEIAELDFLDGSVRGTVDIDLKSEAMRAKARLTGENMDAAALLGLLHQRDWLTGRANTDVEAEVAWNGEGQTLAATSARARVNFPEGGQIRLDIPRLADTASATAIEGWEGVDFTSVSFDTLRFDVTLQNGQLRCNDLELSSASDVISGMGQIDLTGELLDWRFIVIPAQGNSGQGSSGDGIPANSVRRSSLAIQGPWTHPVIRGDVPATGALSARVPKPAAALEVRVRER